MDRTIDSQFQIYREKGKKACFCVVFQKIVQADQPRQPQIKCSKMPGISRIHNKKPFAFQKSMLIL